MHNIALPGYLVILSKTLYYEKIMFGQTYSWMDTLMHLEHRYHCCAVKYSIGTDNSRPEIQEGTAKMLCMI